MKKKFIRHSSLVVLISLLYEILFPTIAYALTGGPSQPETETFSPVDASNSVDLFTGDFNYNIPLLDVGGYPINLSYNASPSLDQEASWVGLGWNINPGSLNRNMRGIPDDFNGSDEDKINKEFSMRPNETWGVTLSGNLEIMGFDMDKFSPGASISLSRNSYKGYSISSGATMGINAGKGGKGPMNASLGLNFGSQDGMNLSASANIHAKEKQDNNFGIGTSFNSRTGLKNVTFSASYSNKFLKSSRVKTGMKLGSDISLAPTSYTPTISMPMFTQSFALRMKFGLDFWTVMPNISISGFYSHSDVDGHKQSSKAYGYMNSQFGTDNESLHDFNREKDIAYVKNLPLLPQPNFTYDLFSATGQGVSGQFRAYRGDAGILFDRQSQTSSSSTSAGVEIGPGLSIHSGFDISQCGVHTVTKKWTADNSIKDKVGFVSATPYTGYEHAYFKSIGEKTPLQRSIYDQVGEDKPVMVDITGSSAFAEDKLNQFSYNKQYLNQIYLRNALYKDSRDKRNQTFSYLTGEEASVFGLDKEIKSYPLNTLVVSETCGELNSSAPVLIPRSTNPKHHISEVNVTTPEGKRYVYGIPAYNFIQKDVTFAVPEISSSSSVTTYNGTDNSTGNTNGIDNYFNAETVPAYAYSYMLTGILSPDYVDNTNDGITSDDRGDAIKFNYSRAAYKYNWRIPFEPYSANYNPGINSGNGNPASAFGDAKASYTYGTKELWYMHSIESKSMVAQFYLESREDGLGVLNEDGINDFSITPKQKLLKEIKLFSKSDLIKFGGNAIPIKTVHFVYDYSLCGNVPNNSGASVGTTDWYLANANDNHGKLTLKKVYFTYGNNDRGRLNAYIFNYDETNSVSNPDYTYRMYDRWSNYKDNSIDVTFGALTNSEFPYVLQNSLTDQFMNVWQLKSIQLPSGGKLEVEYESDDYAYVQDKRATSMFHINGFSSDTSVAPVIDLYDDQAPHVYAYISPTEDPTGLTKAQLESKYLEGLTYINYRVYVNTRNSDYDYIAGYAEIDRSNGPCIGYHSASNSIWIKLKPEEGYNPISKEAWQFMRLSAPELAYGYSSNPNTDVIQAIQGLIGSISDIVTLLKGFEDHAASLNWAKRCYPTKSWLRLNQPDCNKKGGGSRVKSITINDNWRAMTDNDSPLKEYTQEYDYTKITVNGDTISSGVAAWEPFIGSEENPFHNPLYYTVKRALGPTDRLSVDEPVCEAMFPSPSVGYSKVTVRTKKTTSDDIIRTATGSTVSEFYTAYDFPVLTSFTKVDPRYKKPGLGSFYGITREYCTVSQGFFIETNDMHGKQKAQTALDSKGNVISSTSYKYLIDQPYNGRGRLKNEIQTVDFTGKVETKIIGEDVDTYFDLRQQETELLSLGLNFNNEFVFIPPFFFLNIFPLPFPDIQSEITRFRSAVAVKSIQKFGLLDETTIIKDGSRVTTKNVLYDDETGQILLTKTKNEFGDDLFNVTYPAHWAYDGMGPAYKNLNLQIYVSSVVDGEIHSSVNVNDFLVPGDELEVLTGGNLNSTYPKLWVFEYQPNDLRLMNSAGEPANIASAATLKVIRSGRRNQSDASIGKFTILKDNPIVNTGSGPMLDLSNVKITEASAKEFNDKWKINCDKIQETSCDTTHPVFCLGSFFADALDYVKMSNGAAAITANPQDGITVGEIMHSTLTSCFVDSLANQATDSMPFYFLSANSSAGHLEWQFGNNCKLVLNTIRDVTIDLNNLTVSASFLTTGDSCIDVIDGLSGGGEVCIECLDCYDFCRDQNLAENVINPYQKGIFGNWFPSKSWIYFDHRTPANSSVSRMRNDGYFSQFTNFWEYNTTDSIFKPDGPVGDANWVASQTVTKINKTGVDVENYDALKLYSAALYGYSEILPIAIASNSKTKQMANDNFEDYDFKVDCINPCLEEHWNYRTAVNDSDGFIALDTAHTGHYSLRVPADSTVSVYREIKNIPDTLLTDTLDGRIYMVNGCLDKFSPSEGKYFMSAWVKEANVCNTTGYENDSIHISFTGSSVTYSFSPSGNIIEGWQRYESTFDVPSTATAIIVSLKAYGGAAYFDDIRIHPFNSNMKAYVYDYRSQRLMAELDANNYATFYEYNDEGKLIRTKKETDRGIVTLKESRTYLQSQFNQ